MAKDLMGEELEEAIQELKEKEINDYVVNYLIKLPEPAVAELVTSGSATNAPPRLTRAPVDERGKLAEQLGFNAQVNHIRLRKTVARAAEFYPQWVGFRLTAWRSFLPTYYAKADWGSYRFDVIPLRALKAIEAARSADLFDQMQIWTPEGRTLRERRADSAAAYMKFMTDPVCVGIVEEQVFPIVRWGQEDLIPEWRVMLSGGLRSLYPGGRIQRPPRDTSRGSMSHY